MTVPLACPRCGKVFRPSGPLGDRAACPACGATWTLAAQGPAAPVAGPPAPPPPPSAQSGESPGEPVLPPPPKRPGIEDLVDMTAMVDIVFFLLIFFMVTSMQGLYSAIAMPTPTPQASAAQGPRTVAEFESSSDYLVVRIDRDDTVWLEGTEVPSEQELRVKLRAARQEPNAPTKMLVLSSSDARHGAVVMVLDAGNDAGMAEVRLGIDDEL